jgi:hypothetical protein
MAAAMTATTASAASAAAVLPCFHTVYLGPYGLLGEALSHFPETRPYRVRVKVSETRQRPSVHRTVC